MSLSYLQKAAGLSTVYREHNGNKVCGMSFPGAVYSFEETEKAIKTYKWHDEDFLLATYPKNGTHLMYEVMNMLLHGSAEYAQHSKGLTMIEAMPCTQIDDKVPSPRVLNTHYRLDCLPEAFQGKKTVLVLRNPKDTFVSFFYHESMTLKSAVALGQIDPANFPINIENWTFSEYLQLALNDKEAIYGSYFDYVKYMWTLRNQPNMHIVFFENLKRNPIDEIMRLNTFMGTDRSTELIAEIAEQTSFSKMKEGKKESEKAIMKMLMKEKPENMPKQDDSKPLSQFSVYRKGEIGDWKNHFTVAENEEFDKMINEWQKGQNIPFIYE